MQIVSKIEPSIVQASAVAIGFFDGVHKGHQAVINSAVSQAAKAGIEACIVTFKDHPRLLTEGNSPDLLTSLTQRLNLFAKLGIDVTLALPFTEEISHLNPQLYVEKILLGAMNAKSVSIGYNHHFAHNRQGTPELLMQLGRKSDFVVQVMPPVFVDGMEASSSRIRQALKEADLTASRRLLGRPYAVAGRVIHGDDRGGLTGFPTANLQVAEHQLIPCDGVYAAVVEVQNERRIGAVNIGCRPTLTDDLSPTIEVHILDYNQDLYGQEIEVELWEYIRAEKKFPGVDALKAQIGKDCLEIQECFAATATTTATG